MDVDFVRKAVRSIGRLAIKVETAADSCIQGLLGLIETKVTYVVQEAVIVIKDIFRRYPGQYEGIIPTLCENLDALDEPEAKAAMIWILGQFANRIENADELLDDLLYTFKDETVEVSCQTLLYSTKNSSRSLGSTCSTHRRSQTLHLQIQIRHYQGVGTQGFEMGNRRSRQSGSARPRIHVLAVAGHQPRCCR